MKSSILSLLLITSLTGAMKAAPFNYIARFLTRDSLVRTRCNREAMRAFQFGLFKSGRCKACEYINGVLKGHDQAQRPANRGIGGYWGGVLDLLTLTRNEGRMKDAIRVILADESDDAKRREYEGACEAVEDVTAYYNKRVMVQEEAKMRQRQYEKEHPKF